MTALLIALAHEAVHVAAVITVWTVWGTAAFVGFVKLVNHLSRPS